MFSAEQRSTLRQRIIEQATRDGRVTGCALPGSAARHEEDAWSDIDIAMQVADHVSIDDVVSSWTAWLHDHVEVADHMDVHAFGALYRVFLLHNSLQVDLSFWPQATFRSVGEPFHLLFGTAAPPDAPVVPKPDDLTRQGWLYALHARSAVERGRAWQADMMLSELRNLVLALACVRHGLNPAHGRQAHKLPQEFSRQLVASRASGLDLEELRRSLRATTAQFLIEVARHDEEKATSLSRALDPIVKSIADTPQ